MEDEPDPVFDEEATSIITTFMESHLCFDSGTTTSPSSPAPLFPDLQEHCEKYELVISLPDMFNKIRTLHGRTFIVNSLLGRTFIGNSLLGRTFIGNGSCAVKPALCSQVTAKSWSSCLFSHGLFGRVMSSLFWPFVSWPLRQRNGPLWPSNGRPI